MKEFPISGRGFPRDGSARWTERALSVNIQTCAPESQVNCQLRDGHGMLVVSAARVGRSFARLSCWSNRAGPQKGALGPLG